MLANESRIQQIPAIKTSGAQIHSDSFQGGFPSGQIQIHFRYIHAIGHEGSFPQVSDPMTAHKPRHSLSPTVNSRPHGTPTPIFLIQKAKVKASHESFCNLQYVACTRRREQSSPNDSRANLILASHPSPLYRGLSPPYIQFYVTPPIDTGPRFQGQASLLKLKFVTNETNCPQHRDNMSYPVVAEIWTLFEATLMTQAKRLTEDIARRQGKDHKELWALIKPQVKIGLIDTDLGEPTFCSHLLGNREGPINLRCRAPCALGFDACPTHIHMPPQEIKTASSASSASSQMKKVQNIKASNGQTYYKDDRGVVRDKSGTLQGIFENDVLYLLEEV